MVKPHTVEFDCPDMDSAFLSFIAREFHGRGTAERANLSNKTHVGALIEDLGIRQPKKLAELSNVAHIRDLKLPDSFVLKYAHGWSARGVMLLRRVEQDLFFCLLSQKVMVLSQIIDSQLATAKSFAFKKDAWIIEELVTSTIPGKPIPFDYKFYCFGPKIGLIVQIDRNTHPMKVVLLRADFSPLNYGSDYILTRPTAQLGIPLVPLHAAQLSEWAKTLATFTGSPFVSVDLYDSPQGPVFGEFTFSPGGTHKRLWLLERSLLGHLNELYTRVEGELAKGRRIGPSNPSGLPDLATGAECEIYGLLASAVLNGSKRAALRMRELLWAKSKLGQRDYVESWHCISQFIEERMDARLQDKIHLANGSAPPTSD